MNLEELFDRETLIEGLARGVARFLETTDAAQEFGDLVKLLRDVKLLREGTLTSDQAAEMFQLARRTWDRKVAEGQFRKRTEFGSQEPRHLLIELMEDAFHPPGQVLDPTTNTWKPPLNVVDLPKQTAVVPRRGPGRPRNNQKPRPPAEAA